MSRLHLPAAALLVLLPLAGCQTKNKWNDPRDEAAFHPANLTNGGRAPMPDLSAKPDPALPPPGGRLTDAMVGQVNGEPVYAATILEPMAEQLKALGANPDVDDRAFFQRAGQLISTRLRGHVSNVLLLAKARAYLKDNQLRGLDMIVQNRREELLREYGQGSAAIAEERLFKEQGLTIEAFLDQYRDQQLVGFYIHEQVLPLINVTRRDIERWYFDHEAEYRQPEKRTLRLLRLVDAGAFEGVREKLVAGTPFASLASDEKVNAFLPGSGGLLATPIVGKPDLAMAALNPLVLELTKPGQWAGPARDEQGRLWLVGLETFQPGVDRSLDDAQSEIRATLSNRQREMFTNQVYAKAAREGSCSDPQVMIETLLTIAIERYRARKPVPAPPAAPTPAPAPAPVPPPEAPAPAPTPPAPPAPTTPLPGEAERNRP